MENFNKYIENGSFVRWILHGEDSGFWEDYQKKHGEEVDNINEARLILSNLRTSEDNDYNAESVELYSKISRDINTVKSSSKIKRRILALAKYAAIAVGFFGLGTLYYSNQHSDNFTQLAEQINSFDASEESQLILGQNSQVLISEKQSKVEYQTDGSILINNNDTLRPNTSYGEQKLNQLVVPFGKNSSIKLPDGTLAFLNAGSRLVYPSYFNKNKREVLLVGEGFFKVVHNPEQPFLVSVQGMKIEVLGTKFNVSAYPTDDIIETVLVEGKVSIRESNSKLFSKALILEPSQCARYNSQTQNMEVSQVDVTNFTSWHQGFLNFKSADLNRIVKKLERYYNIRIRLDDPLLGIKVITGKLKLREEKDEVLKVLANTSNLELVKINGAVYLLK